MVWATVNVCDTPQHPETIGIRASMPRSRKIDRLFMRFRVQYETPKGNWRLASNANSGFVKVGSGARRRQAGRSFTLDVPTGQTFTLRGLVNFQWRRHGAVVKHAKRLTTAGHPTTIGADPSGYSAETCVISR